MALVSLRALTVARQSLLRDKKQEPKPLRLTGASAVAKLRDAIAQHLPVQFYYLDQSGEGKNGVRYAVPYTIYMRDGKRYLSAYVMPRSTSQSKKLPGWRTFLLSGVSVVRLPPGTDESLIASGARRVFGYRPNALRRTGTIVVTRQRQPTRRT